MEENLKKGFAKKNRGKSVKKNRGKWLTKSGGTFIVYRYWMNMRKAQMKRSTGCPAHREDRFIAGRRTGYGSLEGSFGAGMVNRTGREQRDFRKEFFVSNHLRFAHVTGSETKIRWSRGEFRPFHAEHGKGFLFSKKIHYFFDGKSRKNFPSERIHRRRKVWQKN
ncbi:MAG: hypothetical protein PUB22_08215 [Clostridiales bacterium]|nr:hypothetical protein [Clostridiales bacterium]